MTRTYRNPILGGFYPDPSICRAGSDFYLVNSTFAYFPGIPVFHSTDLRRWKQIGNAIHRPGQLCYDGHRISEGLFAPAIRHNLGVFYITCTLVGTGGNFIITAKDPAGPWSDPVWLPDAPGIDPSLFFDDDGKAWYTGTCAAPEGEAYPGNCEIYIRETDISLLAGGKNPLIGPYHGIWRGALRNAVWPEGPHIYKINGWYYLLYAEGGTSREHAVCVARAKNIHGPWEGKQANPILTHRYLGKNAEIVNTGHADLTDDAAGNWWMALLASRPFQGVCPLGRETFMVPVFWEDDWPCVASKTGLIEGEYSLPDLPKPPDSSYPPDDHAAGSGWIHEQACDHFNIENGGSAENNNSANNDNGAELTPRAVKLPLHWLMLRMPVNVKDAALSLTARPGALRLFTVAETMRGRGHPAFAGRRLRHKNWAFSAAVEFVPKADGESAGIILLQNEDWQYRFEMYLAPSGSPSLRLVRAAGKEDEIIADGKCGAELAGKPLVLAASCDEMEISFFYGKDVYSLKRFTGNVDARILSTEHAGGFVGTLAGVFASGNGKDSGNYADVLWAEYRGLE
ncbi:MAG: glycoside hydrolase family 43 protein [Spirochaetaceae bacterium]|jgi:alpha-N-arabinofuranosidase|nr:glycoside hydrolase family 43 protein [Spirochaetaceae bacterium]